MDRSESGAGRFTHKPQILQAREVVEEPSWDARDLVVGLLRDGEGVGSEEAVDTAHGFERAKVSDGWERGRGGAHHARDPVPAGSGGG